MLFHVKAADPLTFVCSAFALLVAALAATGIPAFRASRINPVEALRGD
jgi:ABC-type lipoprotein release transport system permease subunit